MYPAIDEDNMLVHPAAFAVSFLLIMPVIMAEQLVNSFCERCFSHRLKGFALKRRRTAELLV
ncbi:hypothetical protein D1872_265730 [compost metagenome]